MRAIDSHCHLADAAFAADLDEVVARARAAGLAGALCIVTAGDAEEQSRAERVAAAWPEVRFAVGVHPHMAGRYAGRAAEVEAAVRAALDTLPGVAAIGEIGLDYHYDFSPRDVQRDVFRRQVRLARESGLPVVIHTREAWTDTLAILTEESREGLRGVFHCFSGDGPMVRAALDLGFYVSFAGLVTFPKAHAVGEAARLVPADRLLVETDAPYLAPVPRRGRRNEPAFLVHVIDTLAALRGESPDIIAAATLKNFQTLLRPGVDSAPVGDP